MKRGKGWKKKKILQYFLSKKFNNIHFQYVKFFKRIFLDEIFHNGINFGIGTENISFLNFLDSLVFPDLFLSCFLLNFLKNKIFLK